MKKENSINILYEIAKNEKTLNQEQLNIVLLMTKAFKMENEYLKNKKSEQCI